LANQVLADEFDDLPDSYVDLENNPNYQEQPHIENISTNHSSPSEFVIPPIAPTARLRRVSHPNTPYGLDGGLNLLEKIHDEDELAPERLENVYYPFAAKMDWDFACLIHETSLTQKQIDKLLHLEYVSDAKRYHYSFDLTLLAKPG